ncbi:MAG: hypothetical protein EOO09_15200 [Chitinophagaceae bacterium]|nr:MAG: hypothetical protein EOO09_15200 [Chitinophagaceae bacterium]
MPHSPSTVVQFFQRISSHLLHYRRQHLPDLILLVFLLLGAVASHSQTVVISTSGQTGTVGTNWSTSGTNPVTITASGGTAQIHTSVIQGYLNTGVSVILNNTGVGTLISSPIAKTAGGNAGLTFRDIGNIRVTANNSISSSAGALDIILWADSDNSQGGTVTDFIYCNAGTSFLSNGGRIVMAGGADNGANGGTSGDGIPDGFAWNGSNSTDHGANDVGGLTLGPRGGTGTVVTLISSGGDIILRGATSNSNAYPGLTSQGNLKILSGNGRIIITGTSSTGHGLELTYGASPTIAIESSSTLTPAIDLKGTTSAAGFHGLWTANNANGNILIQSTAATGGGISLEGSTSVAAVGLSLAATNSNVFTQLLSQSGTITIRGLGNTNNSFVAYGDVYIGNRKDAVTVQDIVPIVTNSSANILVQANDQWSLSNASGKSTRFQSTGSLTLEAYSNGYSGTIRWVGNPSFAATLSSITLGESLENYGIAVNNSLNIAGNITAHCSDFTLENGVGLSSSGAGNIAVNAKGSIITNGTTRRTISTVNGLINLFADSDASGNGQLDIDYLTLNAGTGNIRLRAETLAWTTTNNTDKPYINGTGAFFIEPADASFQNVNTNWFVFDQDANGIAGLTIGKFTNTGDIIHETTAVTIAGPISFLGGVVTLSTTLTSSATGDIFIKANTNRSNGAAILGTSSIFKTAGTGTLTMQSAARINSGTVTASGTGRLNVVLWSDFINNNNGGVQVNPITTNGGHLWVGGSNSNGGSYNWNGLVVGDGPSVGSPNNNFNAVDFFGPVSTAGGNLFVWGGNGNASGTSGINFMSSGSSISTGSGEVVLVGDNIEGNNINLTSTGRLSLLPEGGAYPAAITFSGALSGSTFDVADKYNLLNLLNVGSLGGLAIGYYDGMTTTSFVPVVMTNSSNLTSNSPLTIAGGLTLYSPSLTINGNFNSTAAGTVSLYANSLSIAGGANLSSAGRLMIQPITGGTSIGLAGGAGTLALPASYFTNNFTDGFSEIQVGNANAGTLTIGSAMTLRDNLRLVSSSSLSLNETVELGSNHLRFLGTQINAASGKYIRTNGSGRLYQTLSNGIARVFPVGTGMPAPLTLTNNTAVTDSFGVTVSNGVYYEGGTNGSAVDWSGKVNLTWNVVNTSGTTGAGQVGVALGWDPATQVTGSLTAARLVTHAGTNWNYTPATPVVDLSAGTLSYASYTGPVASFAVAQANIPLPVSWLSFTGKRVADGVALQWTTASEVNASYFLVERNSGSGFVNIGQVAATGSGQSEARYDFTDRDPQQGTVYYRLKQVDRDGAYSYSSVVTVQANGESLFSYRSVPGSAITLHAPAGLEPATVAVIYDSHGRALLRQIITAGNNTLRPAARYAGGVYYLHVEAKGRTLYSVKFIW